MKKIFFIFLTTILFSKESDFLRFGAGVHNIFRERHRTAEFLIEYKFKNNFRNIYPFLGTMVTKRGALYIYGGGSFDLLFKNFLISISLAGGYYRQGGGRDLGSPAEFRSAIAFGYSFPNLSRLSISLYHMSNASFGSHNPGTESLVIFYSIPLSISKSK